MPEITNDAFVQVFRMPDGTEFDNKTDAEEYIRKPKIKVALMKAADNNQEVVAFLEKHKDVFESLMETSGKKVKKSDKEALEKELRDTVESDEIDTPFLSKNYKQILAVFKYPSVKKLTLKQKQDKIQEQLEVVTENNSELFDWLNRNLNEIVDAFGAGHVKRQVSEKATIGLTYYRAKIKARKAAEKAGEEFSEDLWEEENPKEDFDHEAFIADNKVVEDEA
jgi:hypothetical protein